MIIVGSRTKLSDEANADNLSHIDALQRIFCIIPTYCISNTHNTPNKKESIKAIFDTYCLNCLTYSRFQIGCEKAMRAIGKISKCYVDKQYERIICRSITDTSIDVQTAIRNAVYIELVKSIKNESIKASRMFLNLTFYLILRFNNNYLIPEMLNDILYFSDFHNHYDIGWRIFQNGFNTMCVKFIFGVMIGKSKFVSVCFVTPQNDNKQYNQEIGMTIHNTCVIQRMSIAPTVFFLDRWSDFIKHVIFFDLINQICSLSVGNKQTHSLQTLKVFIKRLQQIHKIDANISKIQNKVKYVKIIDLNYYRIFTPNSSIINHQILLIDRYFLKSWPKMIMKTLGNNKKKFNLAIGLMSRLDKMIRRFMVVNIDRCEACKRKVLYLEISVYGLCNECCNKILSDKISIVKYTKHFTLTVSSIIKYFFTIPYYPELICMIKQIITDIEIQQKQINISTEIDLWQLLSLISAKTQCKVLKHIILNYLIRHTDKIKFDDSESFDDLPDISDSLCSELVRAIRYIGSDLDQYNDNLIIWDK